MYYKILNKNFYNYLKNSLTLVLWDEKANPYMEKASISLKRNKWPFSNKTGIIANR